MALLRGAGIDPEALLAEALGVSIVTLREARTQAMEARLARDLQDGKITQEQADVLRAGARSGQRGFGPGAPPK
jgi:hypothetical protein